MRVGLISDTHGWFDPALPRLFAGCDLIVHAGDVEGQEILHQLSAIAPVEAVRGNVDHGEHGRGLEPQRILDVGGVRLLVVHVLGAPARLEAPMQELVRQSRARLVVYGHSHVPAVEYIDGILYVNPGSAGPRRFKLPRSAGILEISKRVARVELFDLEAAVAVAERRLLGEPRVVMFGE